MSIYSYILLHRRSRFILYKFWHLHTHTHSHAHTCCVSLSTAQKTKPHIINALTFFYTPQHVMLYTSIKYKNNVSKSLFRLLIATNMCFPQNWLAWDRNNIWQFILIYTTPYWNVSLTHSLSLSVSHIHSPTQTHARTHLSQTFISRVLRKKKYQDPISNCL